MSNSNQKPPVDKILYLASALQSAQLFVQDMATAVTEVVTYAVELEKRLNHLRIQDMPERPDNDYAKLAFDIYEKTEEEAENNKPVNQVD
jgi:uncharacterized Ntn-hydrolase superfamily protein